MGEKQNQPFQLSFNASLKVDFQGSRVTSEGGLILVCELDERLGFGDLIVQHLTDSRRGKNRQLPLVGEKIERREDADTGQSVPRIAWTGGPFPGWGLPGGPEIAFRPYGGADQD